MSTTGAPNSQRDQDGHSPGGFGGPPMGSPGFGGPPMVVPPAGSTGHFSGGGPEVTVLSMEPMNEGRENAVRILKSVVTLVIFVALIAAAAYFIVTS